MEVLVIVLGSLSLFFGIIAFFASLRAQAALSKLEAIQSHLAIDQDPKPKKILVPGKGIFTMPKPKRTPKHWRDDELWVLEQDEKYKR